MKKVGIMGGTFNPIHIGHLIIAERAREQLELDEVLFMPCGVPYKKNKEYVLPKDIRTQMTKLAIEDNPFFNLSTIEVDKEGITYTYETLEQLRKDNVNAEYYFIMGADSLMAIEYWKEPEKIFASCHIPAAVRDGKTISEIEAQAAYLKDKYGADIIPLDIDNISISSSMIRNMIKECRSIRYFVPEPVYDYIIKNKLYKQ